MTLTRLTRLPWLLDGLPADVTGRLRSDRVMYFPAPPLPARPPSTGGRRPRHVACYAQLYLARGLTAGIRLPWQRPCPPGRLTPARVRRGFRRIRQALPVPATAPKPARPGPGRPGPGRPEGTRNHQRALADKVPAEASCERFHKTLPRERQDACPIASSRHI